jgi:indole-3-glycerol phosphate synthase
LTLLDEIIAKTRNRVEARKLEVPIDKLPGRQTEFRSLIDAIERCRGPPVIAEVKPRSPSAGILRQNLDIIAQAKSYEAGGAVGISVLTEPDYFGGNLENLIKVRQNVTLPVLRKDFIIDDYQILESMAYDADAVLLIVSCLGDRLPDFVDLVEDIGTEALVECHSMIEVEKAVTTGATLIGVNNRDLDTMKIDLNLTKELAKYVPQDRILVSESGINTPDDVRFLLDSGAKAVLIGAALMKAENVEQKLMELQGVL